MKPGHFRILAALGLVLPVSASAVEVDPQLPHYEPHPFTLPKDAKYVRPDGSIYVVGAEEMTTGLANLNALFAKSHPGVKLTSHLPGSSVAPAAILFHVAAFGVIDRELFPEELVPFQFMNHRDPIGFKVGRGSFSKEGLTPTMAICVNKANPISELTTEQVARIFTVGGGSGDIVAWGQLGLTGAWARRRITVLGVGQRTGEGVYMKVERFGDFPFTSRYEEHKSPELAPRVAEESSAIAIIDLARITPDVKILAIAQSTDFGHGPYVSPTYDEVKAGHYPYTRYTYFFVNPVTGQPFDPFVKEYLRMVYSQEGQAALTNEQNGFLPLSAKDASAQLRKLALMDVTPDAAIARYEPSAKLSGKLAGTGDDDMESVMRAWIGVFNRAQPGVEVPLDIGTSATAPGVLAAGRAGFAFVGRTFLPAEVEQITQAWGQPPVPIIVAGGTYDDRDKTHAEMVWVNAKNPLASLTRQQLEMIFGAKPAKTWGEIGLTGEWADRPIHALKNHSIGATLYFRHAILRDGEFGRGVKVIKEIDDLTSTVNADEDAIGLAGLGYQDGLSIHALAIAPDGGQPIAPTLDNVAASTYPLSREIYLYVKKAPGEPLDPAAKELLKAILSSEGQAAALRDGYLPLSAQRVQEELAKLN